MEACAKCILLPLFSHFLMQNIDHYITDGIPPEIDFVPFPADYAWPHLLSGVTAVFDSKSASPAEVTPICMQQLNHIICIYLSRNYSACCTKVSASASWFAILGVVYEMLWNYRLIVAGVGNTYGTNINLPRFSTRGAGASRYSAWKTYISFTKFSSGYDTANFWNRLESASVNRML